MADNACVSCDLEFDTPGDLSEHLVVRHAGRWVPAPGLVPDVTLLDIIDRFRDCQTHLKRGAWSCQIFEYEIARTINMLEGWKETHRHDL